ncbi:(4Fe-4S)-binding protein [Xanthomarina gelatinilytica]|uniref:(4Fe-4S)-binding protein n=1 Tax=Xanthomarina gelatinilytica TaxID=1137281 RepID=UPI003AA7B310
MEKFKKETISIIWDKEKCIHAGFCVKTLPNVYKPGENPWINPENASEEEIVNQVSKCPSGALTIKNNN